MSEGWVVETGLWCCATQRTSLASVGKGATPDRSRLSTSAPALQRQTGHGTGCARAAASAAFWRSSSVSYLEHSSCHSCADSSWGGF